MTEGSQVFFFLKTGERTRKVSGVVVELFEKEAVVGFLGELLEGVMWAGAPLAICGFLTALSSARLSSWTAEIGRKSLEPRAARAAWFGSELVP